MARKSKKIIRYRKPVNINIGVIIFGFLFVYLLVIGYMYFTKDKIQVYQVVEGSLAGDSRYTGLILRNETVTASEYSGHLNYYIREGEKAAVGNLIYSVDESGTATEKLAQNAEDTNNLNPENLAALRNRLSRFSASYDSMSFREIYDVKYNLQSSLLEYVNQGTLEELKKSLESLGSYFQLIYADHSGIIVYSTDGYEGFDYTSVTEKNFNKDSYQRSSVKAGQIIENGTNVYKTITDTKWSILFPITETDAVAFADSNTIRIRFVDTGIETTAGFSTFVGADEKPYGKLDLKDYMIQYYNSRYADIELFPDKPSGLKIPASSIVHKDFYVIPADYLTSGGDSNEEGFLREVYQKGENSTVFESPTIYYKTDEYCYVEKSAYSEGDNLIKPDSSEQYKIGPTETLTGVYNINKGYAVFNQVEILDSNEEYCIVAKGTKYGLSAFDHIVLKGNTISEDDIIY